MRPDFFGSLFQDSSPAIINSRVNSASSARHHSHSRKIISNEIQLSERVPLPNSISLIKEEALSTAEFLAQVTQGLGVDVPTLIALGILTQQDLIDLDGGMYRQEYIKAYRAMVAQQLN